MFGFGIIELALVLFLFLLWVPPVVRIIQKAGFSPLWTLLALIPVVNLVALWVFAFARWPSLKGDASAPVQPGPG